MHGRVWNMTGSKNRIVLLMAVVLLLMSVAGTLIVFNVLYTVPTAIPSWESGKISFTLEGPNDQATPSRGSGVVGLTLLPAES